MPADEDNNEAPVVFDAIQHDAEDDDSTNHDAKRETIAVRRQRSRGTLSIPEQPVISVALANGMAPRSPSTVETPSEKPVETHEGENVRAKTEDVSKLTIIFIVGLCMLLAVLNATPVGGLQMLFGEDETIKSIWCVTAYLLILGAFQPIYTKVVEILGYRLTLILALLMFALGSLASALAQSLDLMIIARSLQGAGGSGMMALSIIILTDMYTLQERLIYNTILPAATGLVLFVSPVFVWMIDVRVTMYVNIPIAVCLAAGTYFFVRIPYTHLDSDTRKEHHVDVIGIAFLLAGAIPLFIAIQNGAIQSHGWSSPLFILLCLASLIFLGAFVYIEARVVHEPLFHRDLFTFGSMSAMACAAVSGVSFLATMYYLPIYAAIVWERKRFALALSMAPMSIGMGVATIGSIFLVKKTHDYGPYVLGSAVLHVLSNGLIIHFNEDTSVAVQTIVTFLSGSGIGVTMHFILLAAQSAVPRKNAPMVSALVLGLVMYNGGVAIGALWPRLVNTYVHKLVYSSSDELKLLLLTKKISPSFYDIQDIGSASVKREALGFFLDASHFVWVFLTVFASFTLITALLLERSETAEKNSTNTTDLQRSPSVHVHVHRQVSVSNPNRNSRRSSIQNSETKRHSETISIYNSRRFTDSSFV